jgi:hypothetical protein
MNELTGIDPILSIDDNTSNRKVAFNLLKGCKIKDYADWNADMTWERLRDRFDLQFAPKMVKIEN